MKYGNYNTIFFNPVISGTHNYLSQDDYEKIKSAKQGNILTTMQGITYQGFAHYNNDGTVEAIVFGINSSDLIIATMRVSSSYTDPYGYAVNTVLKTIS